MNLPLFGPLNPRAWIFRRTIFSPVLPVWLVVILTLAAHSPAFASYRLVRNFTNNVYGAGRQNWSITQDELGRMYFGNTEGFLVTDSRSWERYYLPNYSTVRSIINAPGGAFYVGGSEEFGIFRPDSVTGHLSYNSLMPLLGKNRPATIGEIWHIHNAGGIEQSNNIIFQGDHHLFYYNGKNIRVINLPGKASVSAIIGNYMYVAIEGKGLFRLDGQRLAEVPGNDLLADKRIVGLLPLNHTVMVVTAFDGLYQLTDNNVEPLDFPFSGFLKENQVFCAANSGRQYAFGTVNCGVITYNFDTGAVTYSNAETGMQNNTVLSLFFDRQGNLWAGLDNGIDYILYNSPIANLSPNPSMLGAGYTSLIHAHTLWLGTNQGLYSTPYPIADIPVAAPLRQTLKGQVWALKSLGSTLFAACDAGLYFNNGGEGFNIVPGVPGTWDIVEIPQAIVAESRNSDGSVPEGEYALASTYDHFYLLQKTGSGWSSLGPVEGHNDIGGRLSVDGHNNIWISHWMKGVYRLRLDVGKRRFVVSEFFNSKNGLPTDRENGVNIIDGEAVVSTEGGFYHYNNSTGKIEPYEKITDILGFMQTARVYRPANNEILSVNLKEIRLAVSDASGHYTVDTLTFKPIVGKLIAGHEDFNFITPRMAIVASQDGFYEINLDYAKERQWLAPTFVNRVYAGDSLVYSHGVNNGVNDNRLKLPYGLNSLRFEFVNPEYRSDDAVQYSYMLENYDTDWSAWSPSNSKEYTRLHEGDYRLHIRTRNRYSLSVSDVTFAFTIAAPWYRSTLAKIIYLIILLIVIGLTIKLIRNMSDKASRKIARQKEREMEDMRKKAREETLRKDYEIAALKSQQLEHDIKHKSEELSNITMNVVRKNELLLDIASMVTKIQEHPDLKERRSPEVTRQFNKIQSVIHDNISHDDDWKDFTSNFDQAYDNYTQKLRNLHPDLSEGDLRMCCYLRMGLSSKEIAPLLNISYRSVEMSRYRLRKKMNLTREINLTDYLQRL